MSIRYDGVFPILAAAIPDFEATDEDWEEPLAYIFINDMVRFVCLRELDNEMGQLAALLERLFVEGEDEVRYLAMDAIESLAGEVEGPLVAKGFGSKSMEYWHTVYKPRTG